MFFASSTIFMSFSKSVCFFSSLVAIERECQVVHDYYWWPSVKRLYESEVLIGSRSSDLNDVLSSLLQPASFQNNL